MSAVRFLRHSRDLCANSSKWFNLFQKDRNEGPGSFNTLREFVERAGATFDVARASIGRRRHRGVFAGKAASRKKY